MAKKKEIIEQEGEVQEKKSFSKVEIQDSLADQISKNLNKQFKDQTNKMVYFLDEPEDSPTNIVDWISTGSTLLDLAISNMPGGGVPVGRITEISSLEGVGKSLMCAHILANAQKKGGLSVFIDTESATSPTFFNAIGVDLSKMLYLSMETIEDIFEAVENMVETVRKSSKDRLLTIVIDSLSGASTKVEMEADYNQAGYATQKAIILSKAMRKITNLIAKEKICLVLTNQLRAKMNAQPFADPWCVDPYTTKIKIRYSEDSEFYKLFHNKLKETG
jgi:recombination protein RecA